jgi:cell division protein FtsB
MMFEVLKKYAKQYLPYLRDIQDIRVMGMVVFMVVLLLVSWSSIRTIDSNYRLQKQISELSQQNDLQHLSNANLKLQNNYYKTDQYLELAARQNFGLARPGEIELIVPKEVALAHSVPAAATEQSKAAGVQPFWQHNMQAWVDFFLHRQTGR